MPKVFVYASENNNLRQTTNLKGVLTKVVFLTKTGKLMLNRLLN
jgi:hypothetical protein